MHCERMVNLDGKPMRNHRLLMRGEWIFVITCISTRGLLYVKIVYGTTDGDGVYEFIYTYLLKPYNGQNSRHIEQLCCDH